VQEGEESIAASQAGSM